MPFLFPSFYFSFLIADFSLIRFGMLYFARTRIRFRWGSVKKNFRSWIFIYISICSLRLLLLHTGYYYLYLFCFCFRKVFVFIDRVGYSKRMPAIILAGDQCWPFFITLFLSCNWHIVFSDSLFSSNKLGVSIGY